MRSVGTLLIILGIAVSLYGFFMDTSVSAGVDRVNNLGLMNERQIILFVGGVMCIMGSIFLSAAHIADSVQNAPKVSEAKPNLHTLENPTNPEQLKLVQQYEKGEITFEVYQAEWKKLNT